MSATRHDWTREELKTIYQTPFNDLIDRAHQVHVKHFDPNKIQISTLLSIKTGGCPENCAYCPQSVHYNTGVDVEKLMSVEEVTKIAKRAKASGATRFCMGAAWRSPRDSQVESVCDILKAVKNLGMETCVTLGMLTEHQVDMLAKAELNYYNHNLDTSPEYYEKIISTRTYQDRLDTLEHVRKSDINVCCGGIVGMGENLDDRVGLLQQIANLPEHPPSVPINMLVKVEGTPLEDSENFDSIEFVRMIATARIIMPTSYVRLSAGRNQFSDELHALCFFAGANSIHFGEKLLTTPLPDTQKDMTLLHRLGLQVLGQEERVPA